MSTTGDYKACRTSSIELLRIVAMLIIVIHHFCVHGVFHVLDSSKNVLLAEFLNWQMVFTQLVGWGGGVGNTLFMIITGYFMINRSVNGKKIVLLLFTCCIYSWIIEIVAFGILFIPHTIGDIVSLAVPIYFGHNWFVSCYIIFSLFIPFVNKFLNGISQREYLIFLLILYVLQAVIPTFRGITFMNGSAFIFFGFGYALGGYLKKYFQIKGEHHKKYGNIFLLLFLIVEMMILLLDFLGVYLHADKLIQMSGYMCDAKIFYAPLAVALFLYFSTMTISYNSKINTVASSMLGVYLIHDNDVMRKILWDYWFPNLSFINDDLYIT